MLTPRNLALRNDNYRVSGWHSSRLTKGSSEYGSWCVNNYFLEIEHRSRLGTVVDVLARGEPFALNKSTSHAQRALRSDFVSRAYNKR